MRQHGIIVYSFEVQLHWALALLLCRVRSTQVTESCCQIGSIGVVLYIEARRGVRSILARSVTGLVPKSDSTLCFRCMYYWLQLVV